MVVGKNQHGDKKNAGKWLGQAGDLGCCADVSVQHGAHSPMEHVLGFTWNHWMPPLGECLCHMVDEFIETTQNTNKTQLS